MRATIEAQTHRRFLKSHLPFDGLPIYDEVRYIHVARDPARCVHVLLQSLVRADSVRIRG